MSVARGTLSITDVTDGKGLYTLTTNYSYTQSLITAYSADGYIGTWDVDSLRSDSKVEDTVFLRMTNSDKNGYCYIIAVIQEILSPTKIKCKSIGLLDKGETGEDGESLTIKSKGIKYASHTNSTTAPTSGWQNSIEDVNIQNGQYLWIKTTVTYSDDTTVESYSVSYIGTNGTNGRVYMLEVSSGLVIGNSGNLNISSFTVSGYYRNGNVATRTSYSGRFLIEQTSDGNTWTQVYKSSANEATKTITLTFQSGIANTYKLDSGVIALRTTLFASGSTTEKLDMQTSPIIRDGLDGSSLKSIKEQYNKTNSKDIVPDENDANWRDTPYSWEYGMYLWTRSEITYENPTKVEYTTPICDSTWEAIENIQVGARNYLRKTGVGIDNVDNWVLNRATFNNGIVKLTPTSTGVSSSKRKVDYLDYSEYGDKVITISCDAKISDDENVDTQRISFQCGFNASSRTNNSFSSTYDYYKTTYINITNAWQRYTATLTLPDVLNYGTSNALVNGSNLTVQVYEVAGGCKTEFKNFKLEMGNKATDWSPAPEDMDGMVVSVDVEYYLSTSKTELSGGTWQTTAPEWVDGKYMWSRTKTVYGDRTLYSPSENGTCIAGATGATGVGIDSIVEMYLATDQDSGVTHESTGWTESIQTMNAYNQYLWNYEIITYTDGHEYKSNPIIVGMYSENIEEIENIYLSSDKVVENMIPFDDKYGGGNKKFTITWLDNKEYNSSGTSVASTTYSSTEQYTVEQVYRYIINAPSSEESIYVHKWNKDGTYYGKIASDVGGSIDISGTEWSPNVCKYVAFEVRSDLTQNVTVETIYKYKNTGITYNYDETGIINPVGTVSSSTGSYFQLGTFEFEQGKSYRLTGSYDENHYVRIRVNSTNYKDNGDGVVYTPSSTVSGTVQVFIASKLNGQTLADGIEIKPLLVEYDASKYDYDKVTYQNRNEKRLQPLYPRLPFDEVVEISDDIRDVWTKTVPKYNPAYRYYFSATQVKSRNNVTWMNMIYDPSLFNTLDQDYINDNVNEQITGIKTITDLVNDYLDDIEEIKDIRDQAKNDNKEIDNKYSTLVDDIKSTLLDITSLLNDVDGYTARIKNHLDFNPNKGLIISGTYVGSGDDAVAPFKTVLNSESLSFVENNIPVSYINGNQLFIGTGVFNTGLVLGGYYQRPNLNTQSEDYGGVSITWEG